jgi:LysR family transcriptional regulator (chromosome initiation inhibitor)
MQHPFDPHQLRALAAVLREGTFEAAARQLHVTPSAISQRIKALEERVGKLLLIRSNPVTATPEGQLLAQLAERQALLEAETRRQLGQDTEHPTLTIAVNSDSLETWFMPAITGFARRSPARLDLRLEDQEHTADLLRRGEVLAAVTTQSEPVQGCRSEPLGSLRYAAVCTPAFHAAYFAQGVTAEALRQAPVILFNRKDSLQHRYARRFLTTHDWHPPIWWIPSTHAFINAALAGMGWCMNPIPMVQHALDRGDLVMLSADAIEDEPLHWQHWQLEAQWVQQLTDQVREAARGLVAPRGF